MDDPRTALEELIRQRGVNYSSISRLLGRNVSYIQQYLRKGSPRHLDEQDRQILAQFFGVDEAVLGGPVARHTPIIPVSYTHLTLPTIHLV